MSNPIGIATKGKGFLPMLMRGRVIASRYGLTPGKMDAALASLAGTIRQFGSSATLPVTASVLAASPAVAMKYHNQGLELAMHGLHHVDYSMLSFEKQMEDLRSARQIFEHAGLRVAGFRCPYLRWNEDTLSALSASGFLYDSSQALAWDVVRGIDTEAYQRVLVFYQALSARDFPALPRLVNGLVRIPYCLPDDEALVERLQLMSAGSMTRIWLAMLDCTYEAGEVFTLGLHPERVPLCQPALKTVLEQARSFTPGVWIARLDEIAAWYLSLGKTTFELKYESGDLYHIRITPPAKGTILVRSLEVNTPSQTWTQGYRSVMAEDFTLRSNKRPVIGISPRSPNALLCFLQHQGYLVETSSDLQAYSYYLDRTAFTYEDERSLIVELEGMPAALVRLSRWPERARSVLAITGDIDAFTLWDYGRRIWNG